MSKCPECKDKGGFEGRSDQGPSSCRTCGKGNAGWNEIERIRNEGIELIARGMKLGFGRKTKKRRK